MPNWLQITFSLYPNAFIRLSQTEGITKQNTFTKNEFTLDGHTAYKTWIEYDDSRLPLEYTCSVCVGFELNSYYLWSVDWKSFSQIYIWESPGKRNMFFSVSRLKVTLIYPLMLIRRTRILSLKMISCKNFYSLKKNMKTHSSEINKLSNNSKNDKKEPKRRGWASNPQ